MEGGGGGLPLVLVSDVLLLLKIPASLLLRSVQRKVESNVVVGLPLGGVRCNFR